MFIPYTDDDVFDPLAHTAKEKYRRSLKGCTG
jgi:hypothetical protein